MSLCELFHESLDDNAVKQRTQQFVDLIESGEVDVSTLTIGEVFNSLIAPFVPNYRLMECATENAANTLLLEEVAAVRTSAFTNIIGKMVLDGIMQGYEPVANIMDGIFDVFTEKQDGGRWGGIELLDDDAIEVQEGHEYPHAKLSEDYVDTPFSKKRGLIVGLTREMIHFDQTGLLIRRAQSVGERVARARENRMIDVFIGHENPYNRKGAGYSNTYTTSGARINDISGVELLDWTDIEAALNAFADMTDDRTEGEAIEVTPNSLLVMPAKLMTARRILDATQVRHSGSNVETISGNPLTNYSVQSSIAIYKRLQQAHVDPYTGATISALTAENAKKVWFFGDFKKTFKYRTIFPMNVESRGPEHPMSFSNDVMAQYKASERGVPFVVDPWNTMRIKG